MRKLNMLAVASMFMLGSSVAVAAPHMGQGQGTGQNYNHHSVKMTKGDRMHNMGSGMGMFQGLNLTTEQQQKVQVIYHQGQAKLAAMPMINTTDRGALHNLITADKFDESLVRKQLEENSKAQIERRVEMAKIHYDMYQVLTPEQKTQAKTNYDSRMANVQQHMNDRTGHGMGRMMN